MDQSPSTPSPEFDAAAVDVTDVVVEELDEVAGSNCFGTAGSVGCPVCFGTYGCAT